MNTIRVIIHSNFLPEKVLYVDPENTFIDLSKKIISCIKVKNNAFNKFFVKLLSCFYTVDSRDCNMLLKFTDFNNIYRNITSTIKELSINNKLECYLVEASYDDILNYNKRINDEKSGRQNFVDVPLYSESDNLLIESIDNIEELLGDNACLFEKRSELLKSNRFFSWNIKKKKIKGHYYSWD